MKKPNFALISLFEIAALFIVLGSILGLFNLFSEFLSGILIFELLSHFKLQYMISAAILAMIFYFFKRQQLFLLMIAIFILNANFVLPWLSSYPIGHKANQQTNQSIKILLSNVKTNNTNTQKLLDLIEQQQADIIVTLEVNQNWIVALEPLKINYPHKLTLPQEDNFGIALYSKLPFADIKAVSFSNLAIPSIVAKFETNHKPLTIVATHPLPPVGNQYLQQRDNQLKAIGNYLQKVTHAKVLVGDLNISMWSRVYQQLALDSDLVNARRSNGLYPSWPTRLPLSIASIPIDHIMHSKQLATTSFTTGPNIGSDHLPIIAELSFSE